jgi:hypothetical protein
MHRIFCATPGDVEEERTAFYRVMGKFNEAEAMPRGILLVSLALPASTADKRPYQAALAENIRSCRYYIQLLEETWGPPERNFERDYALALRSMEDPEMPMQDVAVMFKKPLVPHQVDPRIEELKRQLDSDGRRPVMAFDTIPEFERQLYGLLNQWLACLVPVAATA